MHYLGETIDIHSGGVDLIFPHHENEIAQSEAATGKPFVRYWVHGEHLLVNGEKMSKSKGNFYTLKDLMDMGYEPLALRLLFLKAHYRTQMNFTLEELKKAEETLKGLWDFVDRIREWKGGEDNPEVKSLIEKAVKKFEEYMDDDLNTPGALASVFEFVHEVNKLMNENKLSKENAEEIYRTMLNFDKVFGILKIKKKSLPEWAKKLIEEREKLRKEKRYEEADKIREELKKKGIIIEDTPHGPRWRYA